MGLLVEVSGQDCQCLAVAVVLRPVAAAVELQAIDADTAQGVAVLHVVADDGQGEHVDGPALLGYLGACALAVCLAVASYAVVSLRADDVAGGCFCFAVELVALIVSRLSNVGVGTTK